jgi:hypothetical protein
MSLTRFIDAINEQITPLFNKWTGVKIHGLAQSMNRDNAGKTETLPALVDKKGEGQYVGIDDKNSVIIYHKGGAMQVQTKPNSGVGDSAGDLVYTYTISMVILIDRKKLEMLPDEIALLIQANLKDQIKIQDYKSVIIRIQNIILNTQQVFSSEYQNTVYKVKPSQSLFVINYQIESTFNKRCFAKCP